MTVSKLINIFLKLKDIKSLCYGKYISAVPVKTSVSPTRQ